MALRSAHGQGHRERLTPAPSTTDTLLIVEALRRHVRLEHRLQGADIDTDLHGRRTARRSISSARARTSSESKYWISPSSLRMMSPAWLRRGRRSCSNTSRKARCGSGPTVGLSGQFLTVETKDRAIRSDDLSPDEVALPQCTRRGVGLVRKQLETTCTAPSTTVEMDTATTQASPRSIFRIHQLHVETARLDQAIGVALIPHSLDERRQVVTGVCSPHLLGELVNPSTHVVPIDPCLGAVVAVRAVSESVGVCEHSQQTRSNARGPAPTPLHEVRDRDIRVPSPPTRSRSC